MISNDTSNVHQGHHLKNFEVQDLSDKYGGKHVGYVALEPIKKGEEIFWCGAPDCMYASDGVVFTRKELEDMIRQHPEKETYLKRYFYMTGDDCFVVPSEYETLRVPCICGWTNHSCEPNCYYKTMESPYCLTALRDIQPGEELTVHYGGADTEYSLLTGTKCKCGSKNCAGTMRNDWWRDPQFQKDFYEDKMSIYVKSKVDQLRNEQQQQQQQQTKLQDDVEMRSKQMGAA